MRTVAAVASALGVSDRTRATPAPNSAHREIRPGRWDGETGHDLVEDACEEDTLAVMRPLLREHGPVPADDLNLGAEHDGRFDRPLSGATLLARLDALAPS